MKVEHAKPRVGSVVTLDRQDFLSGKYAREIESLLVERSALVFPGMFLTDDEQLIFARTIGEIDLIGGEMALQNITLDPNLSKAADYTRGAFYWHIDGANDPVPAKATMLSVRVLPEPGTGDTLIANTYAAYEDLPEVEKQALEGITVRHALEASQRYVNPVPTVAELTRWQSYPSRSHPLVWHHRHGRSSLILGNSCFHVEGMELAEGNMLLARMMEWATQDQYIYRHTWREGDFVIFDNTGTLHRAADYPASSKRLMRRTTLCGEEAAAAAIR